MRKQIQPPAPSVLACGLLEDGERALFLCRKNRDGVETVELPCVLLFKGENPVARIAEEFRRQTGIDAQAHEVLFERRFNAGTRKRKIYIPVLVFKLTAKAHSAKPSQEFTGYKWLTSKDLAGQRRARNLLWL
ncbi:MAG: NUDIX hydrolase [Candidatus Micrarchaeia archaeon]